VCFLTGGAVGRGFAAPRVATRHARVRSPQAPGDEWPEAGVSTANEVTASSG
jgi:hypothetical protein